MAYQDFFLSVETAKQGAIKGESQDATHKNEIDVVGWRWGMQARTALGGGGTAPKATINELVVTKRVDSASTALMGTLRNNDEIRKAILTCRRAGGGQQDELRVTIQKARITNFEVKSTELEGATALEEEIALAFKRITVEYIPQGEDGQPRGSTMFEAEIS
jgi:type VI secretion system secreted protein Hcp